MLQVLIDLEKHFHADKQHRSKLGILEFLDSRHWTLDAGLWTLNAGLWTLDPGAGRWTMDIGSWTLDAER